MVDVTGHLRAGENAIAARVFDTGLGALRSCGGLTATVEAVTRRDGRRFRVQDLDRARLRTASGLWAVPALRFATSR
ncbi:MAG TPA: hypothetical protein VKZ81_09730 [Pseudonocardia sp.]|uniref:hypothetical protein n=1 Tax=Pseudonocardia sp. TaxID=60912 RepID=UPI002B4B0DB3|nr:hypothetical protein [Pseudonocardia sp.]HLU55732.1 hypothetical protein [Pseudonocardia sp.]